VLGSIPSGPTKKSPSNSILKVFFCFKKFEKINLQKSAKKSGNIEKEFAKWDYIKWYTNHQIFYTFSAKLFCF
jgi:hypothetical protein